MVRFHWPVEGTQHCAWVPHGGMKLEEDKGVRHITVDMEVGAAQAELNALASTPVLVCVHRIPQPSMPPQHCPTCFFQVHCWGRP